MRRTIYSGNMPELPEVETIVRSIRPHVRGKQISAVWTNTPRLFREPNRSHAKFQDTYATIEKHIIGTRIENVGRHGKNIFFELSNGNDLLVHLMMSGRFLWNPREENPYIRFRMEFTSGEILAFFDVRKFGLIRLLPRSERKMLNLGPDALAVSADEFKKIISGRRGSIKPLLLNQSVISGIGNIYADEILWYAGIHPLRATDSFYEKDIRKIHASMVKVLVRAVKYGGSTMMHYRALDGSKGEYYDIRKVYRRTGELCSRDGAVIERILVGQRSTHFCPMHQI